MLPSGSCLGMVHRFIIIFHQIKGIVSNAFMLLLVLATYTLHPLAAPWWLVLLRLGLAITYRLPPTSWYWIIKYRLICNCSLVALSDDISPQPHIFDNVDHGSCCMVSLWRPGTILYLNIEFTFHLRICLVPRCVVSGSRWLDNALFFNSIRVVDGVEVGSGFCQTLYRTFECHSWRQKLMFW